MAEKIIQNPSITPNDFGYDGGAISSILGAPLVGAGGGDTIIESDFVWLPSVTQEGVISWQRATSATAPSTANIMGPQGPQGPSGTNGKDGTNGTNGTNGTDGISPTFTITPTAGGTHVTISGAQGKESFDVLSGAKGADGTDGKDGAPGIDGISPTFTITPTAGGTHVTISGAQGENGFDVLSGAKGADGKNGQDGTNGTDGISPTFTITPTAGGTHVTISGAQGKESFDVLSGAKGADGTAGFSPTVSTTTTASEDRTGTVLTFTYGDEGGQTVSYTAWNGKDGTGATVDILEGTGIQITHAGATYTIGVSADYFALKSELPDVTDMATKTWVGQQGYLTSVPNTYALKSDVEAASANAYNEAVAQIPSVADFITKDVNNLTYYYDKTETSSTSEITNALSTKLDSTVAAQTYQPIGNYATTSDISDMATQTWVGQQGYLKAVPDSYATKTYANEASANALSEAESWVGQRGFITKNVDDLTYYYKTTETSSTSEITNALSTKLDSTVAAQTYQTKAGMTNYLTTSDASTTYQPKGNYASASDITDMATKTWVGDQGFLKNTDLTNYATKTYANEASANALSEAKTWVGQEGYLTSVPDSYATKTYANDASANALSEAKTWVGDQGFLKNTDLTEYATKTYANEASAYALSQAETYADSTSAEALSQSKTWVNQQNFATSASLAANTRYEMTNTGWTSAIKIQVDTQVPTTDDGILHIILES